LVELNDVSDLQQKKDYLFQEAVELRKIFTAILNKTNIPTL